MDPINTTLSNSDWKKLVCYLNNFTEITHPITDGVIIHKLISMDSNTL